MSYRQENLLILQAFENILNTHTHNHYSSWKYFTTDCNGIFKVWNKFIFSRGNLACIVKE